MKTITINVTADDIRLATLNRFRSLHHYCCRCPVGRAVSRALRLTTDVTSVNVYHGTTPDILAPMPKVAGRRVQDFDNEREIKPFKFKLRIP